jgi:hypothetical protein
MHRKLIRKDNANHVRPSTQYTQEKISYRNRVHIKWKNNPQVNTDEYLSTNRYQQSSFDTKRFYLLSHDTCDDVDRYGDDVLYGVVLVPRKPSLHQFIIVPCKVKVKTLVDNQ